MRSSMPPPRCRASLPSCDRWPAPPRPLTRSLPSFASLFTLSHAPAAPEQGRHGRRRWATWSPRSRRSKPSLASPRTSPSPPPSLCTRVLHHRAAAPLAEGRRRSHGRPTSSRSRRSLPLPGHCRQPRNELYSPTHARQLHGAPPPLPRRQRGLPSPKTASYATSLTVTHD
jgi:hypothetical protein